jgi:hypothetical protein
MFRAFSIKISTCYVFTIFLSGAVSAPVKPPKADNTELEAFGVELSSSYKWLVPVCLVVVGVLGIIYAVANKFLGYE